MIGEDLNTLKDQPFCLEILQAYAAWEKSSANLSESSWRERLQEQTTENAEESAQWSTAHGLLIAYGLLDIELAGRSTGIQYRITSEGKKTLSQLAGIMPFVSENCEDESDSLPLDDMEDLAA